VEALAFQKRGIGRVKREDDTAGQRGGGEKRTVGGSAVDRGFGGGEGELETQGDGGEAPRRSTGARESMG
jgi:hypothetical protein